MTGDWFSRVPRGFSRHFVLQTLQEKSHTGKEIIDLAAEKSEGIWKPSPGLIYPLLGRLLDEGLIEEGSDGKYSITKKGRGTAEDVEKFGEAVSKQMDMLFRLGNVGRFVAMDMLEKVASMGSIISSNAASMTREEAAKYKKFLEGELRKMEERAEKPKKPDESKDDQASA